MEWSTHALLGAVAGYMVTNDWKGAVVGSIAGVVPDLDEPRSKFGKVFFFMSLPLSIFFEHRTFTHSLLFVFLSGLITIMFFKLWVTIAVSAGIVAHILGDMLTGKVRLLYPLKTSVGVPIPSYMFVPIDRLTRLLLTVYVFVSIYNGVVI